MLRLMPILEHMGACDESRMWLHEKNFATFAEAFDACPDGRWLDWLASTLARYSDWASLLWARASGDSAALLAYYAPHQKDIEHLLVEYAHKNGCAVEVSS